MAMEKPEFLQIYQQFREKVWRLVSKYVSGYHDREDLFQEVFLKIHQALPGFRGESELSTWIFRITANHAINFLKKQKRHDLFRQIFGGFRHTEVEEGPQDSDGSLSKPLEQLNPRQKMILLMADVEEMKLDEISAILKIPLGTVKSNLSRAREIIKKELKENG